MNQQQIIALLQEKISMDSIRVNEQMHGHTTFRVGGPAEVFVIPKTEEELVETLAICSKAQIPFYILGNGSNLLVSDEGIKGVVIQIHKNLSQIKVEGEYITAYAGALLSRIAHIALEEQLSGVEFAHGIPGTLGGAVVMNAGAYDGEMKDVLTTATVLTSTGEILELSAQDLNLSYRSSIIKEKSYIVLKATLKLTPSDSVAIHTKMKDFMQRRKDKQPLEFPSAGSTFKRPEGYFAGKLIMDSGLRGYQIGGARVSDKHCGFIINAGSATCKDILDLIEYVKIEVKRQQGVDLETEVKQL